MGNVALALTPALAAQGARWGGGRGAWEGPSGRIEAVQWRGGRLDSVVDPETSGHFSGGIRRQWEMLAPKRGSRQSRIIGSRAGFSLGSAMSELLSLEQNWRERVFFSSTLHSTLLWAHVLVHIPGYLCGYTRGCTLSALTPLATRVGMWSNTHMHSSADRLVGTLLCQAGALHNRKGSRVGVCCGWRKGFLPEQSPSRALRGGCGVGQASVTSP